MPRTPFGKSRPVDDPYAIYKGYTPFGETEVRVLKTYQHPDKEKDNQYARWFVAVKSDHTFGRFDMGDSYIQDCLYGNMRLVQCTDEWREVYGYSTPYSGK
jgi:hypothetical protein